MFSVELNVAAHAAVAAGEAIMKIYRDPSSDFSIERKADNSPLTIADRAAAGGMHSSCEQIPFGRSHWKKEFQLGSESLDKSSDATVEKKGVKSFP